MDSFDSCKPGWCAMVAVSRLNPGWFDDSDIPSVRGAERRSQLVLTDRMRASLGPIFTEAQYIQGSIVFGRSLETAVRRGGHIIQPAAMAVMPHRHAPDNLFFGTGMWRSRQATRGHGSTPVEGDKGVSREIGEFGRERKRSKLKWSDGIQILVIGGTGFIGPYLVRALARLGHAVSVTWL